MVNLGDLAVSSMNRVEQLQQQRLRDQEAKEQSAIANQQRQQGLDLQTKQEARAQSLDDIKLEAYQNKDNWVNEGTQINTIAQGLQGVSTPEQFQANLRALEIADNGVNAADIQKVGLTFDNYKQQLGQINALHRDLGVRSGYLQPTAQAKVGTFVRTVMVQGKPTDVLYNKQSGDAIRVLGEAKPSGKGVSVNVGAGESEFKKELGKLAGKEVDKLNTTIAKSEDELRKLQQLEKLDAELGDSLYRGITAGAADVIGSIGNVLGLDTSKLDSAQAMNALNSELAFGSREPGTGTFTDADFDRYRDIYANLSNTPEGFRKKLDLKRQQVKYKQDYNMARQDALLSTDGNLKQTANLMKTWKKNNPFDLSEPEETPVIDVPMINNAPSAVTPKSSGIEGVLDWSEL